MPGWFERAADAAGRGALGPIADDDLRRIASLFQQLHGVVGEYDRKHTRPAHGRRALS